MQTCYFFNDLLLYLSITFLIVGAPIWGRGGMCYRAGPFPGASNHIVVYIYIYYTLVSRASYRGTRPTNKHKHTDRGDYNTLRRGLARSVIMADIAAPGV